MYQVELEGQTYVIEFTDGGITVNGELQDVAYKMADQNSGHILLGGRSVAFVADESGDGTWRVAIDGVERSANVKTRKELLLDKFGGAGGASAKHRDIKAPMPGLVLRINVSVGDRVRAGQPLLVLEAMKMENEIASPGDGIVETVHVSAGDAVVKSALLIEIGSQETK